MAWRDWESWEKSGIITLGVIVLYFLFWIINYSVNKNHSCWSANNFTATFCLPVAFGGPILTIIGVIITIILFIAHLIKRK